MTAMSQIGLWVVVLVAFGLGYALVSLAIRKVFGGRAEPDWLSKGRRPRLSLENGGRGDTGLKGRDETSTESHPVVVGQDPAHGTKDGLEIRPRGDGDYAAILGLGTPFTVGELQRQYRAKLAECEPEKFGHLGESFRQAAEQRSKEVTEAFEHFRVKLNLR